LINLFTRQISVEFAMQTQCDNGNLEANCDKNHGFIWFWKDQQEPRKG